MVNDDFRPSLPASARRMRTHIEWKVDTHIARARGPTSAATRSFISPAALLVKVIARTSPGCTPRAPGRPWGARSRPPPLLSHGETGPAVGDRRPQGGAGHRRRRCGTLADVLLAT